MPTLEEIKARAKASAAKLAAKHGLEPIKNAQPKAVVPSKVNDTNKPNSKTSTEDADFLDIPSSSSKLGDKLGNNVGNIADTLKAKVPSSLMSKAVKYEEIVVSPELEAVEGLNAKLFVSYLTSIQQGVESSAEDIKDYLHMIHKNLMQYPELCHILSDEQIGIIVKGFLQETNTHIKVAAKRGGKSMQKLTSNMSKADVLNLLDIEL